MKIIHPRRVSRSYTQDLAGAPEDVFPLLCPVRESEWIDGWDPLLVVSASGVVEPDCVFITHSEPQNAHWYVTRHEPESHFIELLKIAPEVTASRISILVRAHGRRSRAEVTYTHTSLSPAGDALVEAFTENHFQDFMKTWEKRLNHFLESGEKLPASA